MEKAVVRVICAIGQSGQLGLNGALPWEGNRGEEFVADVARFFDITRGHVILAGPKTVASIPQFAYADRTIGVLRSNMNPEETLARYAGRIVYIGGGPPIWDVYARYVSHWDITKLPYDGPADRWLDPKWIASGIAP